MKRTVCICLAALLLVFACACTESGPAPSADNGGNTQAPSAETESPTEAVTEAPTEEPTHAPVDAAAEALMRLALLPDWPAKDLDSEWAAYENVTPEMMREYTDLLERAGFTLIENVEGRWRRSSTVRTLGWRYATTRNPTTALP